MVVLRNYGTSISVREDLGSTRTKRRQEGETPQERDGFWSIIPDIISTTQGPEV